MTEIVPMVAGHSRLIANLHLENLRTPFNGRYGQGLLEFYYLALTEANGAVGYVASQDGEVTGYVCGVWNAKSVWNKLLKSYWLGLIWMGILQVIAYPSLLVNLLNRLDAVNKELGYLDAGYELRPIVVIPRERGTGLAGQLLKILLEDAAFRGFSSIHLITEVDNLAASAFYQKSGFEITSRFLRGGQEYLLYVISTNHDSWREGIPSGS